MTAKERAASMYARRMKQYNNHITAKAYTLQDATQKLDSIRTVGYAAEIAHWEQVKKEIEKITEQ